MTKERCKRKTAVKYVFKLSIKLVRPPYKVDDTSKLVQKRVPFSQFPCRLSSFVTTGLGISSAICPPHLTFNFRGNMGRCSARVNGRHVLGTGSERATSDVEYNEKFEFFNEAALDLKILLYL
ncbi:hypothetical protein B5X24_HaOG212884 [Helicoverpa armigera]|uniref:Uncharacterized protein n=1 Tax=Helicoverpa armigera TaxID=29058 RepID=A0A2W1BFK8_HELAM|nr:hypothetical protein B5X24_HaOG212884 [Helicoverpa armigera]